MVPSTSSHPYTSPGHDLVTQVAYVIIGTVVAVRAVSVAYPAACVLIRQQQQWPVPASRGLSARGPGPAVLAPAAVPRRRGPRSWLSRQHPRPQPRVSRQRLDLLRLSAVGRAATARAEG